MKTGDTVQRFSYDAQGKVVSVNYNGTEYYYLRNAQGDIVKLIDGSGNTVVEYTYDSWGKILSVTGTLESTLGEDQPFRYRGYVYDSDTNLYYLQSRYYNPSLGRFISSDVYLSTGQGVLGHNSYAYCLNNPVNAEDPTGYWGWFSSGKGKQDEEDAGWCGGLSAFTGWARRVTYTPSSSASVQTGNAKDYSIHSSANAAYRAAKISSGIPMAEQPITVVKSVDRTGNIIPGRTYIFKNGIEIRQHSAGHVFDGGVVSSAHYNVSISKWHYFYID